MIGNTSRSATPVPGTATAGRGRALRSCALVLGTAGVIVTAGSCGGGDGPTGPGPVSRVTVLGVPLVPLGAGARFTTMSHDERDQLLTRHPMVWSVSDTTVAVVDSLGWLTTRRPGIVTVIATTAGVTGNRVVTVPDTPVSRLDLSLSSTSVVIGTTAVATVQAYTVHGGPLPVDGVAWSSSDDAIMTVDAAGLITAGQLGTATLSAARGDVTATLAVTVAPIPVASVAITSSSGATADTVVVGGELQLSAVAYAADGSILHDRRIVWSSSSSLSATVDSTGLVRTTHNDRVTIRATAGGVVAMHPVRIRARPFVAVAVHSGPTTIAPTGQVRLRAVAVAAEGDSLGAWLASPASFATSQPAVAWVDRAGVVTAKGVGVATITASMTRADSDVPTLATVEITVAEPPPSEFPIEVRFVGTPPTPALAEAATRAVDRWRRVIRGPGLPSTVSVPAGACAEGASAIEETVVGALVLVEIDSLDGDGGTVGMAGPCVLNDNGLTAVGVVVLDRDDLPRYADTEPLLAENVIAHEMGHVFGIGTLWEGVPPHIPDFTEGLGTADPRFTGPHGRHAFFTLSFSQDPAELVPLENTGGAGTAGAHWRESAMSGELLTGWLGRAAAPLSVVTVNALRDLGYVVDGSSAEILAPGFFRPSARLEGEPRLRLHVGGATATERLLRPRYRIDASGRTRRVP